MNNMSDKPVIFLTFANDHRHQRRFLKALEPEKAGIKKALIDFQKKWGGIVYDVPLSESGELLEDLNEFKGELIIFHFSGHADGTQLALETTEGDIQHLNQQTLSWFLADQQRLKLVFLNGCSTDGQIHHLQKLGVEAIIATSQSIPDQQAARFGTAFYESLMAGHSLKQAYLQAKGVVNPESTNEYIFRQLILPKHQEDDLSFPWGLYLSNDEIENWKLADAFENVRRKKQTPRSVYIAVGILYLLIATIGWFWGEKPKQNFGVDIQTRVDRLSFQYISGPDLLHNIDLEEVGIQQFESAIIPGDSIFLLDGLSYKGVNLEGGVQISRYPDIESSYLNMENVFLQGLSFPDSAEVIFRIPDSRELEVDIFSSSQVQARFYAGDTLRLDTRPDAVVTKGIDTSSNAWLSGLAGWVYPVEQEFMLRGKTGMTSLFLRMAEQLHLEGFDFEVADPQFNKPDNQQRVSSVLEGMVYYVEDGNEYRAPRSLQKGDDLFPEPVENINIAALELKDEAIFVRLTGRLKQLKGGPDAQLMNPSRIEWWWGNHRMKLILLGLGLLGIVFLLPGKWRDRLLDVVSLVRNGS